MTRYLLCDILISETRYLAKVIMANIETQLWRAVRDSGWSLAELARRADVRYSSVHGFARSKRAITLKTGARLAQALGLELRPARKRR